MHTIMHRKGYVRESNDENGNLVNIGPLSLLFLFLALCVAGCVSTEQCKWENVVEGRQTVIAPLTEAHSRARMDNSLISGNGGNGGNFW